MNPIASNRPVYILDGFFAQIFHGYLKRITDMFLNISGYAYAARIGETFHTRSNVDSVAEEIVPIDDYVAKADTNT